MPPPLSAARDPDGLYASLGLKPAATHAEVAAAYRAKARVLHPDVPRTGNASAFMTIKQAYDVLSNPLSRAEYDRRGQRAAEQQAKRAQANSESARADWQNLSDHAGHHFTRGEQATHSEQYYKDVETYYEQEAGMAATAWWPQRLPRLSGLPIVAWAGLGMLMGFGGFEAVRHLVMRAPAPAQAPIRPNAPTVTPLSPTAHRAILYGKAPVQLAGTANAYITPNAASTTLWRFDNDRKALVPIDELPPFSSLQAIRLIPQSGMVEVLATAGGLHGFVAADHIEPGDRLAAQRGYCSYNAGPAPLDGEVLDKRDDGSNRLTVENRAPQPAVLKLRDATGAVAASVFIAPGSHADLDGLPDGEFHVDIAFGELWSRACNGFTAGMRAARMTEPVRFPGQGAITLSPDSDLPARTPIDDETFDED
jgi:hypothetical protein